MKRISETKGLSSFLRLHILILLVLTVISRLLNSFYSIASTDILYDTWVAELAGYLLDGLSCLRYVFYFGAVLYSQRKWGLHAGNVVFAAVVLCNLADVGVRFFLDYISNNIVGMELLAFMWLLLQFAYDTITLALCWITGRMFILRNRMSDSVRRERRYSMTRTFRLSLLYVLILQLMLWLYDVIDFLRSYSLIQSYEYASIAGQFIYVLVLYGGIAFLFSELVQWLYGRLYGQMGA